MTTTNQGISGAFAGTMGSVKSYAADALTANYKPANLLSAHLEKIQICNRFTRAFTGTGFLNKSFPAYGNTSNGYNRATSILMNQALTGNYPDIHLSYPHVLISKGKLPHPIYATSTSMEDGNIYFSFTDNSNMGSASASDKVILVAYIEELQQAVFTLSGGLRKDCEAVLNTQAFKGYVAETWLGFLSDDEMNASNSVYTGRVQL